MPTIEWKAEVAKRKMMLGWGNRELALHAGLSKGVVDKYMSGHYPNETPKERIETALGMR